MLKIDMDSTTMTLDSKLKCSSIDDLSSKIMANSPSFNSLNSNSISSASSSSDCETCSINASPERNNIGYFNYHSYYHLNLKPDEIHNDEDEDDGTYSITAKTEKDFDFNVENVFHKIDSLLMSNFNDLDAAWEMINYLIREEDLRNELAEKFITSSCVNQYLCLLQQYMQSDEPDRNLVRYRIDSFCRTLMANEPEIISMFIPQLAKLSKFNNLYADAVSNFYFANVIKTNLFYADTNNIEIPINDQEINNIIEWLYPKHNLLKLFDFLEQTRQTLNERLVLKFDPVNNDPGNILKAFFDTQHIFTLPILEKLFIFLLHQNQENRNNVRRSDKVNKTSIVFCLRATMFEQALYHFKQWLKHYHPQTVINHDNENFLKTSSTAHNDNNKANSNHHNDCKLSSPYLVGQLYQLAIHLALFGASHHQPHLINQLLSIRLADLDFETYLKRAMEAIDLELNSIDEDRFVHYPEIVPFENHIDYYLESQDSFNSSDGLSDESSVYESVHSSSLSDELKDLNVPSPPTPTPPPSSMEQKIQMTLREKRQLLEKIKMNGNSLMAPVNNRWAYGECSICCESQWLLIRVCCETGSCLDCLSRYYTSRIKMGNISIECIGPQCRQLVYRAEVLGRLMSDDKALYGRMLLMHSSESDRIKPCPRCNKILSLSHKQYKKMKKANKRLLMGRLFMFGFSQPLANQSKSFKVKCESCQYDWCFKCHSPWHEGLSCKDYVKGDRLLKTWAKHSDTSTGYVNAQKCPKCKIYIQRSSGCDHMHCTRCKTDFCYLCGDRILQLRFFGDHYSRLSVLGCKYRYKPKNPVQRKLVRGAVLGGKLMVLPFLSTACLCFGAMILVAGVVIMPFVGGFYFYNRIAEQRFQQRTSYSYRHSHHVAAQRHSTNHQSPIFTFKVSNNNESLRNNQTESSSSLQQPTFITSSISPELMLNVLTIADGKFENDNEDVVVDEDQNKDDH